MNVDLDATTPADQPQPILETLMAERADGSVKKGTNTKSGVRAKKATPTGGGSTAPGQMERGFANFLPVQASTPLAAPPGRIPKKSATDKRMDRLEDLIKAQHTSNQQMQTLML